MSDPTTDTRSAITKHATEVATGDLRLTFQHAATGTLHKAPACGSRSHAVSPEVVTLEEIAEATKCGSCWDGTTYPVTDNNLRAAVGAWSKARGPDTTEQARERKYSHLLAQVRRQTA